MGHPLLYLESHDTYSKLIPSGERRNVQEERDYNKPHHLSIQQV